MPDHYDDDEFEKRKRYRSGRNLDNTGEDFKDKSSEETPEETPKDDNNTPENPDKGNVGKALGKAAGVFSDLAKLRSASMAGFSGTGSELGRKAEKRGVKKTPDETYEGPLLNSSDQQEYEKRKKQLGL